MATVASEPITAAGPNCDALFAEYKSSKAKEDRLFTVALLLVYATVIFIIMAAGMVLSDMQDATKAAAAVALFSGAAAGGIATWCWKARNDTLDRMREWITACPDTAGAALAGILGSSRPSPLTIRTDG